MEAVRLYCHFPQSRREIGGTFVCQFVSNLYETEQNCAQFLATKIFKESDKQHKKARQT
jgi:hypothetical protein